MIVRVSRSRHAVGREVDVFRAIEPLVDGRSRPRGLLDLIVARRSLADGRIERTVISMWANLGDLEQSLRSPWDIPDADDPDDERLTSVDQYEIEADDWPEFVELVRARVRRLS